MSKHHDQIKNDPRWKAARAACLERDGYACVRCGSEERLQADHILRLSEFPDLAFELDNLQTLCQPHHTEKEKETKAQTITRYQWINAGYPELIPVLLIDARKTRHRPCSSHDPVAASQAAHPSTEDRSYRDAVPVVTETLKC